MPFANLWDVTFPPDTQLANLLGQDLRNFRVDTQQRMAAISGLDAAKPAFGADTQPANWNGILFFATDTGKIYQFNNPAWTDVTIQFVKINDIKSLTPVVNTGNTTLNTIYTAAIPPLSTLGQLRATIHGHFGNIVGNVKLAITFGAQTITGALFFDQNGASWKIQLCGGNTGATNAQTWSLEILYQGGNVAANVEALQSATTIDTTITNNLLIKCQNTTAGDTTTFDRFVLEFL